jgi:type VI protein secretion system component VasF
MEEEKKYDFDGSQDIDREEEEFAVEVDDDDDDDQKSKKQNQSSPMIWAAFIILLVVVLLGWIYFTSLRFEKISQQVEVPGKQTTQEDLESFNTALTEMGDSLKDLLNTVDLSALQLDPQAISNEDQTTKPDQVVQQVVEKIKENESLKAEVEKPIE